MCSDKLSELEDRHEQRWCSRDDYSYDATVGITWPTLYPTRYNNAAGKLEYLLKWVNYPSNENYNLWEESQNCNCDALILQYLEKNLNPLIINLLDGPGAGEGGPLLIPNQAIVKLENPAAATTIDADHNPTAAATTTAAAAPDQIVMRLFFNTWKGFYITCLKKMIRHELGGFTCRPTLRESALETESQNWSGIFVRYPHSLLHLRKPKRMEGVKIQLKMFYAVLPGTKSLVVRSFS
ncbi:hypothetical protein DAPPUDRAFT_120242 [Daphnia pulex]|uniref:Chromo domain-containing protein n=1 Tax=Daphnia pulex TaxID=6669 RepID=E9I0P8_DAPPU|nr:hypothetical protein DAPPUDRAFT_120242 [Daphnia pulex]|eukprot:EFX62432.1 hypothetical protein DAPPUDRAFT_120242 [Daphnia pulex]